METVRLDKWLWAARFFKTRMLAKKAIESGKVHINDESCKVSRQVKLGDILKIRQGYDEKTVTVIKLSEFRGTALSAALLYEENADSIEKRKEAALERKATQITFSSPGRPTKRDRRKIIRFLEQ